LKALFDFFFFNCYFLLPDGAMKDMAKEKRGFAYFSSRCFKVSQSFVSSRLNNIFSVIHGI
jgi:hypothetical protein